MGHLDRVTVGVLKGGISKEREISLLSGKEAALALTRKGIPLVEIDIVTSQEDIVKDLILKSNIDVAFIALHGVFGEDGEIQRILDGLGIPYTGSGPQASRLAMDKIATKETFRVAGIPTANFFVLDAKGSIPKRMRFPKVIKPHYSGSSIGVSIVTNRQKFKEGLRRSFKISNKVIVEDYIEGRELTVGILDDRPLSVVEIIPKKGHYDFKTKYTDGLAEFHAPAQLSEPIYKRVMQTALKAHLSLGCRHFSRADIRLSKSGVPFILEINTIPGLTSHSLLPLSAKVCGIDFDSLIVRMVMLALSQKVKA